jgi:hypothetical protein
MKKLIQKLARLAGIVIVTIATLFGIWYYHTFIISPLDRPWILSTDEKTIEVTYVNWACDCADFIETKNYADSPTSEPASEDYLFIEPANPQLALKNNFYEKDHFEKNLRLTGHFYIDKGVPASYEMKTPEKPEHARVFRYDKIEYIDKGN